MRAPAYRSRFRFLAVLVISSLGALSFSACGSKSDTSGDSAATVASATPSETMDGGESAVVTDPAPASAISYKATWRWDWLADTGDLEQDEFRAGAIGSVQDFAGQSGSPISVDTITNYCGLDPQRDALAPLQLTQTNGNASFEQQLASSIVVIPTAGAYGQVDQGVEIFTDYGSKFACSKLGTFAEAQMDGSGTWDVSCEAVAPGASCSVHAVLIVRGYFTPQNAGGDSGALGQWNLGEYTFRTDHSDLKNWQGPGDLNRLSPLLLVG